MKKRSIGIMILLTIVTLGFYSVYWYCSFQNQLKNRTGEGFNGFGHLMATIFSFGIYFLYWQYKAGKRIALLGGEDNSILYLLLSLFAFGWLNPYLMQHQVNKLA